MYVCLVMVSGCKGPLKCYVTQMGVGGVSSFQKNSVTKVKYSTLLALRGGGLGSNFLEKSVT